MHRKAVVPYVFLVILVLTLLLYSYKIPLVEAPPPASIHWSFREHDSYGPGASAFTFTKQDATTARQTSSSSSQGDSYLFTNRSSVLLNMTFIELTWQGDFSYVADTFTLQIWDGIYDRTNDTQFPAPGWPLGLPAGVLYNAAETDATLSSKITKSYGPMNLNYTQANCTIIVRLWDAWSGQNGWLDLDRLRWIDTNNVTILEDHHFTGDVVMEKSGTNDDYGYLPAAAGDTTSPIPSNINANTTQPGQPCEFSTLWSDNVNMSGYIFGTNNTGTFTNETWTGWSPVGTPEWSNITKTLNSTSGVLIQWQFWANDTSNNWNTTGIQTIQHTVTTACYATLDGFVVSSNLTYSDAWTDPLLADETGLPIGQTLVASYYSIYRSFLRFDTSSVPDRAIIQSAILSLYGQSDSSATDFLIQIQEWTGASDGLSIADFDDNLTITYDDGTYNTTSWNVNSYNNITFGNITIINAVGYTDLVIRSSRDITKVTPTGAEYVAAIVHEGSHEPILYVTYILAPNNAPTIGEFEPVGTTQQNGDPFFLNCTVNDADGVNDITYVWMTINGTIHLKWANVTDAFTEERDDGGYCTLDAATSNRTLLNSTAYSFAWYITLSAAYPEGNIDVLVTGTNATDGQDTVWGSYDNLFYFDLKEWFVAETWLLTLRGKFWDLVEQWMFSFIPKAWVIAEFWGLAFGYPVAFPTGTLRAMLLIGGLGMFFLPLGIIIYKKPKPTQVVTLFMIMIIGFALILGFIYMT